MYKFATLITVALFSSTTVATSPPTCLPTHIQTKTQTRTYNLELATTNDTRMRGLMNRESMGTCDGMAFFFSKTAIQKFWMKNTQLPLDIIFVDEKGTIVYIAEGKPLSLEPLGPNTPIATVIELDRGRAEKEGIHVGDKVQYEIATTPQNLAR